MNLRNLIQDIRAKEPILCRAATLSRVKGEDGKESEDTFELSFSSEEPYERYFGVEILGHKKTEVKMDWIKGGSAPLLLEHNRSQQIGVVDKATLADGRATAVVRFGKTELAKGILADVVAGIRKNVSVGYEVNDMILIKQGKDGESSTYRVTDWKPLEISIVSLPADPTVGVGRGRELPLPTTTPPKEETMNAEEIAAKEAAAKKAGQEAERKRATEIRNLCNQYQVPEIAAKHIDAGDEPANVREAILTAVFEKAKSNGPAQNGPGVHTGQGLGGISKQDKMNLRKFSLLRALEQLASGMRLEGIEAELHQEAAREFRLMGKSIGGFGLPLVYLRATLDVDTDGTNLVGNQVFPSILGTLRKKMILRELGATVLTGLTSDVTFSTGTQAVAAWAGTGDTAAGTGAATSKKTISPKRICLTQSLDKKLIQQSTPDIEAWLRENLATAIALGIDLGGLFGTGADDQPTGVANTVGIGSVAGGSNGLAPTWAHIVGLESAVAAANADVGSLAYATNAVVRGKLKTTPKVSGTETMIWDNGTEPLNGHRCSVSNQIPSNLTKGSSSGVCSAILYGDWSQLIVGMFGGLDLVVDNVTRAKQAEIVLTLNSYADVGVITPTSFAAMLDALTA